MHLFGSCFRVGTKLQQIAGGACCLATSFKTLWQQAECWFCSGGIKKHLSGWHLSPGNPFWHYQERSSEELGGEQFPLANVLTACLCDTSYVASWVSWLQDVERPEEKCIKCTFLSNSVSAFGISLDFCWILLGQYLVTVDTNWTRIRTPKEFPFILKLTWLLFTEPRIFLCHCLITRTNKDEIESFL